MRPWFLGIAFAAGALLAGRLMSEQENIRIVLAGAAIALVVGFGAVATRRLLYVLVVWLAALGLIRRLASTVSPVGEIDPLLLVGPAAIVLLLLAAAERGALRTPTTLSKAVLLLSVLTLAGALNPLQGGLLAGLAGLLLVLVPMLAFWVGRSLCDDRTLGRLLTLVAGLGVLAASYGLLQTFGEFPSWDASWIRESGYTALNVDGVNRPFASFASAAEYGFFLAIAIAAWAAFGLRRGRVLLAVPAIALLTAALLYESSRGVIFTLVLALGLMAAAWRRVPGLVAIGAGAAALLLLTFAIGRIAPEDLGTDPASTLLAHQLEGLGHPFDPEASTFYIHRSLVEEGLREAVADPLGHGFGLVTLASAKFGGGQVNTETDVSNVAVALGIPGLLVYAIIFAVGFRRSYEVAVLRHDALAVLVLGVLAATLFQWLNGGQYSVAILPWLLLGWVDRTSVALDRNSSSETHAET